MKKFIHSVRFALNGIRFALRGRNFRIQCIMALIVLVMAFLFRITSTEWSFVLILIAIVLGFEMINTALEKLVDVISPQYSVNAGKIKDIAAGAVLVASVIALAVGIIIFLPYLRKVISL